ncbi:hypothetical protein [Gemmata massiliana]|uniref:hypothetical protein n=1 Tax=Gemmata massiliana TaxID=1210884 RepID=UPI0013A6A13D|nr:hypothetical protein [Gemmata massiliana]
MAPVRSVAPAGVWPRVFEALQDPDLECRILEPTVILAHPCAAGAPKSRRDRGQGEQALGRSRGGFGTKIHVRLSGLGLPTQVLLECGPRGRHYPRPTPVDGSTSGVGGW